MFEQIEQHFGGAAGERREVLIDEQMQQLANVVKSANVANCVAKVETIESFAHRVEAGHFFGRLERDLTVWCLRQAHRRYRAQVRVVASRGSPLVFVGERLVVRIALGRRVTARVEAASKNIVAKM